MESVRPSVRARVFPRRHDDARAESAPTEAEIEAFGQWYEAQPAEWVEFLDELGKQGSSQHR